MAAKRKPALSPVDTNSQPVEETSRAAKIERRGGKRSTTRPPGWGGPAKGKGRVILPKVLDAPGPGRGYTSLAGDERRARDEQWGEEAMQLYYRVMNDKNPPSLQMQAATHILNRVKGMPVQTVMASVTDDLTDDERKAQVSAFRSATLGLALPRGSDGVGDPGARASQSDASATSSGTD